MDTLENIGISCNLLTYNEKIFKIKMAQRDEENDNDYDNITLAQKHSKQFVNK